MPDRPAYARVLVEVEPDHLDRTFDYRIPDDAEVRVGSLVEVPFGGRRLRGIVAAVVADPGVDRRRVRAIRRVLGPHRWLTRDELGVIRWAADRFAAPAGNVLRHALPERVVAVERAAADEGWFPGTGARRAAAPPPPEVDRQAWDAYGRAGQALLRAAAGGSGAWFWRPRPGEDTGTRLAELAGITLAAGRDVLVVVPDPASGAAAAVAAAAGDAGVDVRGGPGARRLYRAWLRARCGAARVVVGERGVAFWPLARPGLLVVVEEASPALKERRSPRHHAREVILERARRAGAVGLLVGTVPSANAWRLLAARRLEPVVADRSVERASAPAVLVDAGELDPARLRVGRRGIDALGAALDAATYGVVLAARRGEGRALACRRCGLRLRCPVCDASLDPGSGLATVCEGCGRRGDTRPRCDRCGGATFVPLRAGARRLGAELGRTFPDTTVAVLQGYAQPAPPPPALLVVTRGSVQPSPPGPVGAVVLPDLDGQLRRPALDAAEDALRVAMTVAAWVGTAAAGGGGSGRAGRVVVQTGEADHHAVQALVRWDPGGFWRAEAALRRPLRFPPAAHAVRIDADGDGQDVAVAVRAAVPPSDDVLGPLQRDGRAALLIKCDDRVATVAALAPLRSSWSRDGRDVRVDVDPVDVG